MIEIIKANGPADMKIVKDFFIEYQLYLNISLCFQGFEEELATLPYKYAEPEGTILLAKVDNTFAGVVALKKLETGICEMKRLYIKPVHHGKGLGKLLAERVIEEAKQKGYTTMKLDTMKRLETAYKLYYKLGFVETSPYNYNPASDIVYFEKTL